VCLLKPQFETGASVKHGVVKQPKEHVRVITEVCDAARSVGFVVCGLTHSPIAGGEGNIEFLLHLSKNDNITGNVLSINDTVKLAWEDLKA